MKASVWANVLDSNGTTETVIDQFSHEIEIQRAQKGHKKGKKRARKGQEKILSLINENPYISVASIAKECGMSFKTARNIIDELRADNVIIRVGPDKGGYWKVLSE